MYCNVIFFFQLFCTALCDIVLSVKDTLLTSFTFFLILVTHQRMLISDFQITKKKEKKKYKKRHCYKHVIENYIAHI